LRINIFEFLKPGMPGGLSRPLLAARSSPRNVPVALPEKPISRWQPGESGSDFQIENRSMAGRGALLRLVGRTAFHQKSALL